MLLNCNSMDWKVTPHSHRGDVESNGDLHCGSTTANDDVLALRFAICARAASETATTETAAARRASTFGAVTVSAVQLGQAFDVDVCRLHLQNLCVRTQQRRTQRHEHQRLHFCVGSKAQGDEQKKYRKGNISKHLED